MSVSKLVDTFSGEPISDAQNDNATDEVKEFATFVDEIIHLPNAEAYAALQTEKSIDILARMKVNSGDKDHPKS